jgi:large subunit ribosomal protein L27e
MRKRTLSGAVVRAFIKAVDYSHLFPTRYTFNLENLQSVVSSDTFNVLTQRDDAKKGH